MTHGIPNGIQPNYGNSVAQQRAAQHLQQRFGQTANTQINQLQAQAAMSHQGYPQHPPTPQNTQLPPAPSEQQRRFMEEQRQRSLQQARQLQELQQAQQSQQRPQVPNAQVSAAQTDGAGEWDAMVAQRRAAALNNPDAPYTADLTIRQQLEESSRAMEGGGLMLPLSEQPKRMLSQSRKSNDPQRPCASQVDGPNDDSDDDTPKGIKHEELGDEDDEDAINSDLDDPDDNVIEEEGEASSQGQIMLCTYDKVQRVKNKWKCILKDGVLTTGGKE